MREREGSIERARSSAPTLTMAEMVARSGTDGRTNSPLRQLACHNAIHASLGLHVGSHGLDPGVNDRRKLVEVRARPCARGPSASSMPPPPCPARPRRRPSHSALSHRLIHHVLALLSLFFFRTFFWVGVAGGDSEREERGAGGGAGGLGFDGGEHERSEAAG